MGYNIPSHLQQDIADFAQSRRITPDEALVKLVQAGLQVEEPDQDHLFTPEVLEELQTIVGGLDKGERTYSSDEVDEHFRQKREAWGQNRKG